MQGKDLLALYEISPEELRVILKLSRYFKNTRRKSNTKNLLNNRSIAMIFEKPSTRTRVSFQVAVHELGGHSISLSSSELQLGRGETIEDTAKVLSRYVHAIMARVNHHSDLIRLAKASEVPVINGLSDLYHPLQILADLMTLQENKGRLDSLKVAWVGDGNNVCNSWLIGAALAGIRFVAATPYEYKPHSEAIMKAKEIAKMTGSSIDLTDDPIVAVKDADCVITDTFVSMGFDQEREKRMKIFMPRYQVNKELMSYAKRDAIFQHCLPAHRGEEVTSDVIDGPSSVVFEEAENRLHTTKALLSFIILGRNKAESLIKNL